MSLRKFRRNIRKAERTFFNWVLGALLVVGLLGPIVTTSVDYLNKYGPSKAQVFWSLSVFVFLVVFFRNILKSKDDKYVDKNGYVVIVESNELEHRHIAKQILGRELGQYEIVHHINGVKTDNEIGNLCLMNNLKHEHFHSWLRWKKEKSGRYPSVSYQKRILEREYGGTLLDDLNRRTRKF